MDGGSVEEDTWISVEEFNVILEKAVGERVWSPGSNAKEIQSQRGGDGRVYGNSDGELALDVHKVGNIEFVIIDISRCPRIGGSDCSDGDKSRGRRIEHFKEPRGAGSGNSDIHLDSVSTDNFEIVATGGAIEIVEGLVGEV